MLVNPGKYRLVTKGDMDGLLCGIMLKHIGLVDRFSFIGPWDIVRGSATIAEDDITAGLPYKAEAFLAFDHYPGTITGAVGKNLVRDPSLPSTSRVIYNHYGKDTFTGQIESMLTAVDKGYRAQIDIDEILYPTGWDLFNYLIDDRTGLEKYGSFTVSYPDLMTKLIQSFHDYSVWEILDLPEVSERLNRYFSCVEQYKAQIMRCSSVHYNLVVTDLRKEKVIYPGNRFMVYALFPECNVSMQVIPSSYRDRATFVVGKSVIDRSFSRNIGEIIGNYGGRGHRNAGTCRVDADKVDTVFFQLTADLKYNIIENMHRGYFNFYER